MRIAWIAIVVVLGCGTTDNTGGSGSTAASSGQSSSSTGGLCIPGQQIECACPGGAEKGAQVCLPDATGYGPCEGCGGSGSTSSGQGGASSGASSTTTTSSSSSGAGGAAPECMNDNDCPQTNAECEHRACTAGKCELVFAKDGTKLAMQTPGDCLDAVCDGQGGTKTIADLMDIQDDANACTTDACAIQGPTHVPVAIGTSCPTGLCNGGPMCVAHIPVQCKVKNGGMTYVGCDGVFHAGLTIVFGSPMQACNGAPSDVGYCSPGSTCAVDVGNGPELGTCL